MAESTYMITIDLQGRNLNGYQTLVAFLRSCDEWIEISEASHLIRCSSDGEQLLDELKKRVDTEDFVLVAQISGFLGGLGGSSGRRSYQRDRVINLRSAQHGIYGPRHDR